MTGTALVTGGSVTANTGGAALATDGTYDVAVADVDFGEGAADNERDVQGCDGSFGLAASFRYCPGCGVWCE